MNYGYVGVCIVVLRVSMIMSEDTLILKSSPSAVGKVSRVELMGSWDNAEVCV